MTTHPSVPRQTPEAQTTPDNAPEQWEQMRRSVAMLAPGAWAMRREQALQTLTVLISALKRP
ncbi:MAG: hypothetical protein O3C27_03945 [Actinomycetota bacterium]|nr:hypothetical protein [Actinomycetota bacterium]